MSWRVTALGTFLFQSIRRPSVVVESQGVDTGFGSTWRAVYLLGFFGVNLALASVPVMLTTYQWSVEAILAEPLPELFAFAVQSVWQLLVVGFVTLVAYHGLVVLTFQSKGWLVSVATVSRSVALYLMTFFTTLQIGRPFVATAPETTVSLLQYRVAVAYPVLSFDYGTTGLIPAPVPLLVLVQVVFLASILYYGYALYVGTRANHDADFLTSILVAVLSTILMLSTSLTYQFREIPSWFFPPV